MSRKLTLLLMALLPCVIQAQEVTEADTLITVEEVTPVRQTSHTSRDNTSGQSARFGYLSYSSVIRLMPEYISAQKKLTRLQEKYEAELQRSDKEFNRKYAEFLEGQQDFPENILRKRQRELQELMDKSIQFRDETNALFENARKEMTAPVMEKLNEAIRLVGTQNNFDYILNTDNNAYPFINESVGTDITNLVKTKLNIPIQ